MIRINGIVQKKMTGDEDDNSVKLDIPWDPGYSELFQCSCLRNNTSFVIGWSCCFLKTVIQFANIGGKGIIGLLDEDAEVLL